MFGHKSLVLGIIAMNTTVLALNFSIVFQCLSCTIGDWHTDGNALFSSRRCCHLMPKYIPSFSVCVPSLCVRAYLLCEEGIQCLRRRRLPPLRRREALHVRGVWEELRVQGVPEAPLQHPPGLPSVSSVIAASPGGTPCTNISRFTQVGGQRCSSDLNC